MELLHIIELFTPPVCAVCGVGSTWLCSTCSNDLVSPRTPHCYRCGALSDNWLTCGKCRRVSAVHQLISNGPYTGSLKELVDSYKYRKRRMLSPIIAEAMCRQVGSFNGDLIITAVPSARTRVRERGFDHAERLARGFAKLQRLPFQRLLERTGSDRQVGVERSQRFAQVAGVYKLRRISGALPSTVVLVDDVVTSGATVEAAARELKKHPAVKRVVVVCLARNI